LTLDSVMKPLRVLEVVKAPAALSSNWIWPPLAT
jgi:hypothetical protein